ncbi:biofilm development regulator YmgB/AriR family protein [Serratia bockelmannii]|uniref:biofilm development regulator YmgB/AriR family protein n=1 Tax=Serratia TaxID=613 RepID=UPI001469A7F1|nr:biofilm development regulator YmgB/AriR family protein [Serratia marcescens]NMT27192.1 hypothetical protein [Serratia marcescens]
MNKRENIAIEISNYFSDTGITLKNEFELLGLIVAEMSQQDSPLSKKAIILKIYKRLEAEKKEELLFQYRKLLAFFL